MEHAYYGWSHWLWLIPVLFMILMCLFGCRAIRTAHAKRQRGSSRSAWSPFDCWCLDRGPVLRAPTDSYREILDRRYAAGEITREQYEQMKHDLERPSSGDSPRAGEG